MKVPQSICTLITCFALLDIAGCRAPRGEGKDAIRQMPSPLPSPDPYEKVGVLPEIAYFLQHDTSHKHDYGLPVETRSTPGFTFVNKSREYTWKPDGVSQLVVFKHVSVMFYVKSGKVIGASKVNDADGSLKTLWGHYDTSI